MSEPSLPEESIFTQALEIQSAADRAKFLDRACGDNQALRSEVEALLRASAQSGDLLDLPENHVASSDQSMATEGVGEQIGPYKLVQKLGEGGMGTVFLAEQNEPVRRQVALKIVKGGLDTAQVLARFEAERQALAVMDHPNIAKVFDAGTTVGESGASAIGIARPYFVMELIKGIPLTKYCDKERLSTRERLALFIPVCEAVQHAHQKGIIHRDLKPSNILIGLYDGKPVPKIIDFGVAKAAAQNLTERTMFTEVGQLVGTLEYMAPEQAEINNLDIDTRADIYSLGVILYELLAGSPPFTAKQLRGAAFDEMLRMIREVEPPKPSTRLSSSDELPSIAANRKLEPKRLTKLVHGELDWIAMKCLEKERERRYETANGLARDLQRYLADEPVVAGPPSAAYRLRKLLKRNKGPVIAACIVLLALVGGVVGTTWGLVRADQARQAESEQRQKAEQAETDTLADYRASTDDAIEQLIGSKPDLGPQERTYLEKTLKRWQAFAARLGDDERSRAIRGEGHYRVGYLWQKLGRSEESRAEYQASRDIWKNLIEQFPAVPVYQLHLAQTHHNLGLLLAGLGKRKEARSEHETALDIGKKLAKQFPAEPAYQIQLADNHHGLAFLLAGLGMREEARSEFETALDIGKKLVEQFPAEPAYKRDMAVRHNDLGVLLVDLGKHEKALVEYQTARDIQKKLVEQFPAVPAYRLHLATTHNNRGILLRNLGGNEEARAEFQAAREIGKKLVKQFSAVPAYQIQLAGTHNNLGVLLLDLGKREEARTEFQSARDLQKKLVEQFPAVPAYQIELGACYCNYGDLLHQEGKPAESLEWYDLAIRTLQPVHDKEPRVATAKEFLRNSHQGRAQVYDRLGKFTDAAKDWDRAIELSPLVERWGFRASRATSQIQAGMVIEAVAEVAELTASVAHAPGSPKWNAAQWYDFACVYAVASGKIADKKQEYADKAMEFLRTAVKAGYKDSAHIKKDTDLDPLRDREDFEQLLRDLGAKDP